MLVSWWLHDPCSVPDPATADQADAETPTQAEAQAAALLMSANLYASVAEFRERLGLPVGENDFMLDRALQSASRWIDRTLGRRFFTTAAPETRYFTACNAYWYLETGDLLSVTTLATDANGDGVYETTWTVTTDYWLGPRNAPLDNEPYTCINKNWTTGRYTFPAWQDAVQITGQFGYCTLANVPAQIRELCMLVAESTTGAGGGGDLAIPGVQSYKIGTELSVTMGNTTLPSSTALIVDQFRRGGFVT